MKPMSCVAYHYNITDDYLISQNRVFKILQLFYPPPLFREVAKKSDMAPLLSGSKVESTCPVRIVRVILDHPDFRLLRDFLYAYSISRLNVSLVYFVSNPT
jgi:hypothetical protein